MRRKKVGDKTVEGAKKVGDKTVEGAKKAGSAVKKASINVGTQDRKGAIQRPFVDAESPGLRLRVQIERTRSVCCYTNGLSRR